MDISGFTHHWLRLDSVFIWSSMSFYGFYHGFILCFLWFIVVLCEAEHVQWRHFFAPPALKEIIFTLNSHRRTRKLALGEGEHMNDLLRLIQAERTKKQQHQAE